MDNYRAKDKFMLKISIASIGFALFAIIGFAIVIWNRLQYLGG